MTAFGLALAARYPVSVAGTLVVEFLEEVAGDAWFQAGRVFVPPPLSSDSFTVQVHYSCVLLSLLQKHQGATANSQTTKRAGNEDGLSFCTHCIYALCSAL